MWFDVEAVPLSFTETAPYKFETVVLIDAPPARVFAILATGEAQKEWFQDFVDLRWTSPGRAVGAEREVELKALTVRERFLAWEPGKRLAFTVYGSTLPLLKAMLEDMVLEPVEAGGQVRATRLIWRAHYEPSLLMRLVHPLGRMIFGELFKASGEGLARYAKAHPT